MWRVYPDEGYNDTCWLPRLWSTQTKVEGIMLNAAWHWGSDSSVINDPLGEPGHTPLNGGLLSAQGLREWQQCSPCISWEGSFLGNLTDIN